MRTTFPALLGVFVALSLGSVAEANAQTRADDIAIRHAVDTMTVGSNLHPSNSSEGRKGLIAA